MKIHIITNPINLFALTEHLNRFYRDEKELKEWLEFLPIEIHNTLLSRDELSKTIEGITGEVVMCWMAPQSVKLFNSLRHYIVYAFPDNFNEEWEHILYFLNLHTKKEAV